MVVTADKQHSGTDSRVFITLFGKTGATPRQELKKSEDDRDSRDPPFQDGNSDEFVVKCNNVGPIKKIRSFLRRFYLK